MRIHCITFYLMWGGGGIEPTTVLEEHANKDLIYSREKFVCGAVAFF